MTRGEALTRIREFADAESHPRWTDSFLLAMLDVAHDEEWGHVLAAAPYYRTATRSVTADANGLVPLSGLDASGQRFYRVIHAREPGTNALGTGRVFRPKTLADAPFATELTGADNRYWRSGDNLVFSPDAKNLALEIVVSHLPTLPSALANNDATVVFPAPYEILLAIEAAALALGKGGAETSAARELRHMAEPVRESMLSRIGRESAEPVVWRFSDSSGVWGGQ